jgi:hypothetical protein
VIFRLAVAMTGSLRGGRYRASARDRLRRFLRKFGQWKRQQNSGVERRRALLDAALLALARHCFCGTFGTRRRSGTRRADAACRSASMSQNHPEEVK